MYHCCLFRDSTRDATQPRDATLPRTHAWWDRFDRWPDSLNHLWFCLVIYEVHGCRLRLYASVVSFPGSHSLVPTISRLLGGK